jgi:restriction endonuclease Mrr
MPLPSQPRVEVALLDLLRQRGAAGITPEEAYEVLADHFHLSEADRALIMANEGRLHWENRVRYARRRLKDLGHLDGSTRGVWKLQR